MTGRTSSSRFNSAAFAVILTTLVGLGCGGGSSPTAPGASGGTGVVVSFRTGTLSQLEPTIRRELEATFSAARRQIPIDGLSITVDGGRHIIPGWGVGGFAPAPGRRIEISVDPSLPEDLLIARLPSLTAHELHHVGRHRSHDYGATLLTAMISEGLADHYAMELFGEPLPPWVLAIPPSRMDEWIERARPEFDSRGYDHGRWFFGRSAVIPRWAGYSIGFELVQRYKDANPGATAAALIDADANLFRP